MSQNTSHAVMAQRHEGAESFDLFPTPPWATRALCEWIIATNGYDLRMETCWEPACGLGHMARPLSEYFSVTLSSDVVNYGFGAVQDFLLPTPNESPDFDWIITNPPFKLAEQFAQRALDVARLGVALFVRTAFLEGIGRFETLFSTDRRPSAILQFTERVPIVKGRIDGNASTATAYCWIVWKRPAMPHTAFEWIPPCRRRLERPGDYAEAA